MKGCSVETLKDRNTACLSQVPVGGIAHKDIDLWLEDSSELMAPSKATWECVCCA